MVFPDFEGNNIVNLMSSIITHFNGTSKYTALRCLKENELKGINNIILIVIDGLGYNFVKKYDKNSILLKKMRSKITTVFPSTTAAAMTSIYTGHAPKNHGVPAWFTYLKELGLISAILLFIDRATKNPLQSATITPKKIFAIDSLFKNIEADQFMFLPKEYNKQAYGDAIGNHAKSPGYETRDMESFFSNMLSTLLDNQNSKKKYILGHWPYYDASCHEKGANHPDTINHFQEITGKIEEFVKQVKKESPDTKIFITADHGMIDTPKDKIIYMKDHPELAECLTLPITGEARAPFFFVRPSKVQKFEAYIEKHLSYAGNLMKGEEAIERGIFGLFQPHKKFYSRIGDYIFFLKEDYIIAEFLVGEREHIHEGNHGGIHEDEMYVPLVIF